MSLQFLAGEHRLITAAPRPSFNSRWPKTVDCVRARSARLWLRSTSNAADGSPSEAGLRGSSSHSNTRQGA